MVDAKGEQIVTSYFPEDRVQDVQYLTAGGIAPDLGCVGEVLSYDGEGNLQGVREQVRLAGFGQVERRYGMSYDRRDRLVVEWRDSALEPPENPRRRQVAYGYDAADNVTLVKDDGVTSVTYRYDEQNWLEQATLANGVTVNYGWQPNGLVESVTYSNGMSRSFGYDQANRVKLVENRANGLSERFEYDYDLNGNRSTERRYREGTLLRALTFGYDLLDRMQTVTDGTRSISYSYDDVGNRLTETGTRLDGTTVSYTYRYDGANRLQDIQDGTGTVIASYGHDANGNITSITRGNESWSYDYDVREQMVKASRTVTQTQPETEAGYYSYDFGKRRVGRKWDADGWTWSVYGQDSVVSEYDSTGNQQNRYEYAGGTVVRGEQDGYYFSDAQGSVTFVAGTEPQVTRTEYDPWGVILSGARDGSTISYTGQWRDDQTGLMPLGNGERYYDPLLGRFIQEDSFAGMYTLPQSLNRYIYGHDNPLLYVDPTGMAAEMAARGETHELFVHLSNQSGFWNQVGGWGGLTLYEVANTITLGAVEREDRTWTAFGSGKISGGEAVFRSVANISLSTVHLVAAAATGGTSLLAEAGIFAGLTAVQQFGIENYEIAYEGRQSLSSLQDYVVNAAFAGGMTIGLGFVGRVANQARVMSQAKTIKEGVEVPHGMLDLLTGAAKKVVHQELALMAQELQPLRQFASRMSPGRQLDIAVEGGAGKANKARREIGCGLKLCFAAGTPVQTRDGQRNIEDLRVGDEVLSYNEQTGQTEYQPITALYAHQNALVLNVTVEGEPEPLKVTPEHPFLAYRARNDLSSEESDPDSQSNGEWIEAGHLKVGDQLRIATGTWATITDIKAGGSVEWAYNFEVAGNHTYFVGRLAVIAHNSGEECDDIVAEILKPGTPEHKAQRWKDYQERMKNNQKALSYEKWSNVYDANMKNATIPLQREVEYRTAFSGKNKMLNTPHGQRQIDIYVEEDKYLGQLKTGYEYLNEALKGSPLSK
ncbi:MAG: Hint domain-containing protein [Acidobacteria bacterium]|nr:Hint domain-containing protein [Acidobacteriota bacterium]